MPHQALCIISSPYVFSNRSYGPETAKLGFDFCDLDLWLLTLSVCMDNTSVNAINSWKIHDDTMMETQWKCVTDGPTDRQTDRQTDSDLHSISWTVDSMRCCRLVGWKVPTNFKLGKDQCYLHWTLPGEKNMHIWSLFAVWIFRISWLLNGICIEPFCRKRSSWQPQRLSSWQPRVTSCHCSVCIPLGSLPPIGDEQWLACLLITAILLRCFMCQGCVSYLLFIS